jgi:hypothetical protein
MPRLEVMQSRQISASIRLDETTATQVDKALNYVFGKDRAFQDFLKTPETSKVSSILRIRKAVQSVTPSESTKKPVAAMPNPKDAGASGVAARA